MAAVRSNIRESRGAICKRDFLAHDDVSISAWTITYPLQLPPRDMAIACNRSKACAILILSARRLMNGHVLHIPVP